ncbi:uncharacterized protein E0L32_001633 [Thyridium curvatum]|uniref:Major facilitator superfamily (MFS) profile domain-containing protein n=1 Tax=Thyridium curvatum TaxID=1093900 RepID=A0A507AN61_9PEZI|nr:uncharacterized protein E0L32_001564 [Thyridium curvatum]XP_030990884.1 uncharacterized protein E0L32_001633 [Thyridium curvatum]TPX09104.1 hypothetical protein E0L32_001564 [Thyridium curvatum]TPX09173.1 hypothetical protein E0L32_001633 [Thyridium curvatum]
MAEPKHSVAHQEAPAVSDVESKNNHLEHVQTSETAGGITGFEADADDLPPGYFKSRFFLGSMFAIGMGLWATVAAFGYAAPILGQINADLGPDPRYVWIANVYNCTLAVCIAPVGRLSDIFGRRYWWIGSACLSVVGCIVCATAKSVTTLIGGSALLGISSATQLSFHYVMGEIVPIRYRYLGSAAVYIFCIPGSGVAPSIAYAFVNSSVGWRGIYYLLTAVNVVALICWVLFYFPPSFDKKHRGDSRTKTYWIMHFDYVGTFLYAGGLIMFLMGLSWGGAVYPWKSAATISAIVVGGVVLAIFVLWEIYAPLKEPLVPMHLFRNREWVVAVVLMGLGAGVYYAFAIVWPMQAAVLYDNGNSARLGGIADVIGLAVIAGQVTGGTLAARLKHNRFQVMGVMLLGGIFLACTAVSTPYNFNTALAMITVGVFFVGWNETICIANSTICVRDQKEIGIAGGLAGSIRSGICSVMVAIYTTTLTNRLTTTVAEEVPAALVSAGLPASSVPDFLAALTGGVAGAMSKVPGITDGIVAAGVAAYKVANADAYRTVYLSTLAFSGLAICLSWWAPDTDKYLSSKVAATLHREDVSDEERMQRA